MIDIDEFLPLILTKAPGCPYPSARIAVIQAANDICERSRLWKYTDTMYVQDESDIDFTPPDGSLVLDFETILFGDQVLTPKTTEWMDQCMRGWRRGTIAGYPKYFTQTNVGTLRIAPLENGEITISCTLRPSQDAEQLPDFLYQQYSEMIAWGALARILSTPEQPFTDFGMGAQYLGAFNMKLDSLSFKEAKGQQRARLRTRGKYM